MSAAGAPSPLSRLLKEFFQGKEWEQRLEQHTLFLSWEAIVGKELAEQARPDCIRGDVLWLKVADSVWMQQLQYEKISLLEAINRKLGARKLKDIRFKLETANITSPPAHLARKEKPSEKPVSAKERLQFEKIAEPVKDEELKEILQRLWLKSRRTRNY